MAYAVVKLGNLQVYHMDGLGSVRAISDNNGNVIETYQTNAFGVPTQTSKSSSQPCRFTGQQVDANGLVYLRARMDDPTVGRFLSRDPLLGKHRDRCWAASGTQAARSPTFSQFARYPPAAALSLPLIPRGLRRRERA